MLVKFEYQDSNGDIGVSCNEDEMFLRTVGSIGGNDSLIYLHASKIYWLLSTLHRAYPEIFNDYIRENFVIGR